ncbi:MAG: PEP-CTERM sorting domain-containing protein [Armatimonadetes bacterium]|nr:PEP-CTERM sorting domain-containing protein [Armatimonadota bacterium]
MFARRMFTAAWAACLLGWAATAPAHADTLCNFESGLGHNFEAIGNSLMGLSFSTVSGGEVRYADINSGWYSVKSDNGKVYADREYFVSGDVAAYITDLSDKAKVAFTSGPASYFTVWYSSEFPFIVEAYAASHQLLASVTGPANTKSKGGAGLTYLTVSSPGIAYVLLHDEGGYWLMDNISTDAPVPEPSSLLALASGLAGLGGVAFRRGRR